MLKSLIGRLFGGRRGAAFAFGVLALGAAPTLAEAACVAAAINGRGEQIAGTRSVTRGVFPAIVCSRALTRCERRLNRIRAETGFARRFAQCEVIASGLRAASVFGPPLERWSGGPRPDDFDDRYAEPRYDDRKLDDRQFDDRTFDDRAYDDERFGDQRYDDRDFNDERYDDRYSYDEGALDDRYGAACNYDACSRRYRTFRASDCSYKPNVYERKRCPL